MFAHAMGWPEIDSEFYRVGTEMEKTCLRLADAVFSSSECSIGWCRRFYELRHEDVPVIHTGVDTSLFTPKPVPKENRPTIIFVGRVSRNKGVEALIAACCRLTREIPDLHLWMLGNGEPGLLAALRQTVVASGCDDLLELRGFIRSEDLPEQLSRAHVFAAPSVYEGGPGFVYLEAMACGLPVIGCAGSGLDEIIETGRNGVVIPPNDVDALAEALHSLLTDPAKRKAMGQQAREYVVEHASREDCLERMEAFYLKVVEQTRGRPNE